MKLEKKYLIPVFLALKETEGVLSLKEARTRDEFFKPLLEKAQTFETDRAKIYEKYGTFADNQYTFKNEVLEDVNAELLELANETVDLPNVKGIKDILEKTTYKPKTGEAELIYEVIEKLS